VTWDGLRRDRPFDRLSPMRVKPNNLGGFGRRMGWVGGARRKHEPKPGRDFPYIGSESVFLGRMCRLRRGIPIVNTHNRIDLLNI
jgi:hypothetical protein